MMAEVLKNLSKAMTEVVTKAGESVVQVNARHRVPASGIVWSEDGVIVTASHVVQDEENITVGLPNGETVEAILVGRDPATDLAVLRVEAEVLVPPAWADSESLEVGELVLALGRPGEEVQASLGMLSALGTPAPDMAVHMRHMAHHRGRGEHKVTIKHDANGEEIEHEIEIDGEHEERFERRGPRGRHQRTSTRRGPHNMRGRGRGRYARGPMHGRGGPMGGRGPGMRGGRRGGPSAMRWMSHLTGGIRPDVVMYPGFSGGPLVRADGSFAGLNSSALFRSTALTLPADTISSVVESLLTHGRMRSGYLGVGSQPARLPEGLAQELDQRVGLLIVSIEEGSPAQQAELMVGDIIVSFDDTTIQSLEDLLSLLTGDRIGQETLVKVVRGGQLQDVTVVIGDRS